MTEDRLARYKTVAEIAALWLGVVALVFGGGWSLFLYSQQLNAGKAKLTLQFQSQYSEGRLMVARLTIAESWRARNSEYRDALRRLSEPDGERAYAQFIVETVAAAKLESNINEILDFFDNLAECVKQNLCQREIAKAVFQRDAARIRNLHYPYIVSTRKSLNDESIGSGIEFVKNLR